MQLLFNMRFAGDLDIGDDGSVTILINQIDEI